MITERIKQAFKVLELSFPIKVNNEFDLKEKEERINFFMENISKDFSEEEIEKGIKYIIEHRKYSNFPTYAEIRESIFNTDGSKEFGEILYLKILKLIQKYGTYRKVLFEDPVINTIVIECGGWNNLGLLFEEDLKKIILEKTKLIFNNNEKIKIKETNELISNFKKEKKEKYGSVLIEGKTKYWLEKEQNQLMIEL